MRERKYATNAERQAAYRWRLVPEKQIQADIVTLLETVGAAVYKIGTTRKKGDHQGTMQTPGIPDLVAFVRVPIAAVFPDWRTLVQLWIEVKRPGGNDALCANWIQDARAEGWLRARDRRRPRGLGLAGRARGGEVAMNLEARCEECGLVTWVPDTTVVFTCKCGATMVQAPYRVARVGSDNSGYVN